MLAGMVQHQNSIHNLYYVENVTWNFLATLTEAGLVGNLNSCGSHNSEKEKKKEVAYSKRLRIFLKLKVVASFMQYKAI